ncbi:MAG: type II secretion system protein [Acidimicrobiia bacterium]
MADQHSPDAPGPAGPCPRHPSTPASPCGCTSRRSSEDGFTLLELMIAVAIMGLLMAIAIPTFLGARTRAQDSQATNTIRATFDTAAAILSSPNPQGTPLDLLEQTEPRYAYTFAASTDPETVSFALSATPVDMVRSAFTDPGTRADEDNYAIGALIAAKSRSGSCVVGIWHLTAGTAVATVPAAQMPTCRAADVDTTIFDDVYRRGGTSTGGADAYICADPSCFGDSGDS